MPNDEAYFDWMIHFARKGRKQSYDRLFRFLHDRPFDYILPMDANRAEDGRSLRLRFARETGRSVDWSAPCSVLEMMLALALRCEEQIMDDPGIGDRTGVWFFSMVDSLQLGGMDDPHFDPARTDVIVNRFLHREYAPTGRGGLFTVHRSAMDMRRIEIWYQMMAYLDELTYGGDAYD